MKSTTIKILSLLLAFVTLTSFCSCQLAPEFEETTTTTIVDKTPIVGERNTALAYYNSILNNLKTMQPTANAKIERKAKKFKCDDKVLKANLSGIADKVLSEDIEKKYKHGDEEKNFNDFMTVKGESWVSQLTVADIQSINWYEHSEDKYRIVILLGDEENPTKGTGIYGKAYDITTKDYILSGFASASDYFVLKDYSTKYHDGQITCTIDRETDHVTKLVYEKHVTVTAEGAGVNNLESLGDQTITFEFNETCEYEFDYDYLNPEESTTEA